MNTTGDFHIHSPFCPHGTNDSMEAYIIAAINKGVKYLTFTEHAPLPTGFIDPTPDKDSAMSAKYVDQYINEAQRLKRKYQQDITVNVGFEVDYIEGFEQEIAAFCQKYEQYMRNSILSVHMLKAPNGEYVCIDFSAKEFEHIISLFGSVEEVYSCYYQTIEQAIVANLGNHKPIRIGHLTLINKFSKLYPAKKSYQQDIISLLKLVKQTNLELDANTAGFFKQHCLKSYPDIPIMTLANQLEIPLVFGSDSHRAEDIGRGFDQLKEISLSLPDHVS